MPSSTLQLELLTLSILAYLSCITSLFIFEVMAIRPKLLRFSLLFNVLILFLHIIFSFSSRTLFYLHAFILENFLSY